MSMVNCTACEYDMALLCGHPSNAICTLGYKNSMNVKSAFGATWCDMHCVKRDP